MEASSKHNKQTQMSTEKLREAAQKEWDLVVLGGGITGAGVALEASRRGLSVLLLEQKDFASGTSSRSSKMVHGGLRYLAMGDSKLTREALQERELLLKEVPGLVDRMGYYFLLKKSFFPWRLAMKIILGIYDRFAGIKDHRLCSNDELNNQFKHIDASQLNGAAYYTDAVTNDCRLVLRVLQEAQANGSVLLNYCKALQCDVLEDGWNQTSCSADGSNDTIKIKSRVVVNSTGAWADRLREKRIDETRVRPLRGSHLILAKGILPLSDAICCSHPTDKRSVFIFPWEGHSVIGTTDLDHKDTLDQEPCISAEETSYLLDLVNHCFPQANISREHVISSFSGVRPVIASDTSKDKQGSSKKPSKERRDHAVWDNQGLVTASGGKLTTFRVMALDVLEKASTYLPNFTFERGSEEESNAVFRLTPAASTSLPENQKQRLAGCYGFKLNEFISESNIDELNSLPDTQYCIAELRWALKYEWVQHLDDLLLRRSRLGLLLPNGAKQLLPQIKPLCQQYLSWDEHRWGEEVDRYLTLWQNHYSLPEA